MAKKEKYITLRTSKAGNESYEVCIRKNDQTFRKSIAIKDFPSKKEALAFAKNLRDQTLVKMSIGYTVSGFRTVHELYEKTFELFPVSKKTAVKHGFVFAAVIAEYGDMTIDKITSADIQLSVNRYAKTHSRKDTSRVLTIWRRIYKVCAMSNINVIDRTVAVTIPDCARPVSGKKEISKEDLETFIDTLLKYASGSITGHYRCMSLYYAIRIMQYCGLRPAECFALTRDDIDLDNHIISITKSVCSDRDLYLTIGDTKTPQSVRDVPIPSALVPYLEELLEWSRHYQLFADYAGHLQETRDISTLVRNVALKAGVDFNLYMLRHQFSTDLFKAGTSPVVIRDLMGHESATMSLEYAVSDKKDRAEAIEKRLFS